MKKNFLLIAFFTLTLLNVSAQSKMNFSLAQKVKSNSTQATDIFVKGNVDVIKQLTGSVGGTFKYFSGDIAVVNLPINEIGKLITNKNIERIEAYPQNIQVLSDTMLINNRIVDVHSGQAPLTQGYDGSGVIVAFIDTGIDYTHPDFIDSAGKTRVKFLWDQNQPYNALYTPQGYTYGQAWDSTQIDAGLAGAQNTTAVGGHGTHVAGLAVGNARASGTYKGAAPKSDIIFVALNFNSNSSTLITDAVNYIFSKAQILGKPCVINASLGTYTGSHDGLDLEAQMIKNMLNQQPGRAMAAAVGNSGSVKAHLGYTVTSDTNFTLFTNNSTGHCYMQIWADTNDLKNVHLAIGADKMSPIHTFRGKTAFHNLSTIPPIPLGSVIPLGVDLFDTIKSSSGNRLGIIEEYADLVGGTYSMEYYITPDSTTYNWRLITTGSGKFDLWSYNGNGTQSYIVAAPLPSSATMPDSVFYKLPDTDKTVISGFQCLDNVITVGNYTNRKSFIDNQNALYTRANTAGAIDATSSHGPTRDGRIKPDIASPGDFTVAAVPLVMIPGLINNDVLSIDTYHVRNGSSSHACPGGAGAAALYLQAYPFATAQQVQHALVTCARLDQFTTSAGSIPNGTWGHGKIDAFAALTTCSIVGITEHNLNTQNKLSIYPNPSSSGTIVNFDITKLKSNDKTELKIYNSLGALVKTVAVNSSSIHLNNSLRAGIYFCHLIVNGKTITSEKMIVL
jgi:minor extracellular serine protease Vpr